MADASKPFVVEYAPQGRAKCKTCKQQIEKKSARIGKVVTNPFSDDGGLMKQWHHVKCIFELLSRARATTRKIESTADLDGFDEMEDNDRKVIEGFISGITYVVTYKLTVKMCVCEKVKLVCLNVFVCSMKPTCTYY
jgi:DNA ligase-3